MGNSGLVSYTRISPNKTAGRGGKTITKFTPHHAAGNTTVEALGTIFAPTSRQASSNYGIGSDGRVGMYVEEKDRSWCSSSAANDNQAITVEVANDKNSPDWTVSEKAYNQLIDLIVDCCRRNPGIKQKDGKPGIYCDDTPNASLTFHKYFSATGCAQPYLWQKRQDICAKVNAKLNGGSVQTAPAAPTQTTDNDKKIWDFLAGKGLNAYAVAGLMGNLYAESGLKPTNLQNTFESKLKHTDDSYTKAVDSGSYTNFVRDGAGYGLAQWTYWSRKENLYQYARLGNKSIGDLQTQLEFLWKELQGYTSVMATLRGAKTLLEASNVVLTQFEKPADQSESVKKKRAEYGQTYYDKFVGKATAPATPATPSQTLPYKVRVTAAELNIRKGPGTNYAVQPKPNDAIRDKSVYTIVEESTGVGAKKWGKLKSGAGWIALDFTTRE